MLLSTSLKPKMQTEKTVSIFRRRPSGYISLVRGHLETNSDTSWSVNGSAGPGESSGILCCSSSLVCLTNQGL